MGSAAVYIEEGYALTISSAEGSGFDGKTRSKHVLLDPQINEGISAVEYSD